MSDNQPHSPPPDNTNPGGGLWTTDDVATYLKLTRASARAQLSAWGITPIARQPGRKGLNLYDANQVREHAQKRPGRGYRSDLRKTTQ